MMLTLTPEAAAAIAKALPYLVPICILIVVLVMLWREWAEAMNDPFAIELPESDHEPLASPKPLPDIEQAKAAAHRYTKGLRVSVQAPPQDIQLVTRHAAHIHVIKPTEEQPA